MTGDHTRRDLFDRRAQFGIDRALAIDRLTERIDHTTEQFGADRHFQDAAGTFDRIAFRDVLVFTQNHGTDRVALEVHREAEGITWEFQHLALHHVGQTMDAADTVGDGDDRALIANLSGFAKALDPALDQFADFRCVELHSNS